MVEQDVTKDITDDDHLSPMAMRAKETLGGDQLRAIAAMGYFSRSGDQSLCRGRY
jgi:hypothetical protein